MTSFDKNKLIAILDSLLKINDLEVIKFAIESLLEELKESESNESDCID